MMIDTGVLGEDDHVELVDGRLVEMSPQEPPHALATSALNRLLVLGVAESYRVRCQLPLTMGELHEPEPDFAVVPAEDELTADRHPTTALLVVEVALSSLAFDRKRKSALYAEFGVDEYWIVNLPDRCIEVYRDPAPVAEEYGTIAIYRPGETIEVSSLPGLRVGVSEVIRPVG